MTVARLRRLAAAAALAVAAAGCGLGPGERTEGEATLTVTRDYGTEPMVEAVVTDPSESETVIRFLDREAEITTRFGGDFVHSINGLAGEYHDGSVRDWFFYVDGLWSPVGSAEREVLAGQRIWWDYRDWTHATRVPAVVGSWPEPFAQAAADEPLPVSVQCRGADPPCEAVAEALDRAGVHAEIELPDPAGAEGETARLLVGPWPTLRDDPAAALLDGGPRDSGVFARFERVAEGWELLSFDEGAQTVSQEAEGAGLVAALRDGERPPTWLVTGTDADGVNAAVELLDAASLENRYAVATAGDRIWALPEESAR